MTDRDEVAELADRLQAKRDDFLVLMDERAAHAEQRLEAIEVQNML